MTKPPTETETTLEARAEELLNRGIIGEWTEDREQWLMNELTRQLWATDIARFLAASPRLVAGLLSALAAARAEGERQGLEQAAAEAEACCPGCRMPSCNAQKLAKRFRTRAEKAGRP